MKILMTLMLVVACTFSQAQDTPQQIMEKRAKEFHRVIGLSDRGEWEKFITDNYTEAFISKAPSRRVMKDGEEQSSPSKPPVKSKSEQIENKVGLMEMLHNDFGNSKLQSLKYTAYEVVMNLATTDGMRGTFKLTYAKEKPYLIDNLGVEASR